MNRDASTKYLSGGAKSLGWGPQGLGLGYPQGAAILISILLAIFLAWKLSGMTFQIRDIVTFRGEALFWAGDPRLQHARHLDGRLPPRQRRPRLPGCGCRR